MMHLKEQLLAATELGLTESDFSSHESDLYVLAVPGVWDWLYKNYPQLNQITTFNGKGEWAGRFVYDIPFANGEWWDAKAAIVNPPFAAG